MLASSFPGWGMERQELVVVRAAKYCLWRHQKLEEAPGKRSLTSYAKGTELIARHASTRRAGCHESGSSGSREALRSNPWKSSRVIPKFYPIEIL
jgi:hypothetical protein